MTTSEASPATAIPAESAATGPAASEHLQRASALHPRNPRKSIQYVVGHFAIIVAGVLVALAVDEWRSERADRGLERQYLARLSQDLIADTSNFARFQAILETKAQVLRAIVSKSDELLRSSDAALQLERLNYSSFIALPLSRSSTFQELQSTGKLGLIQDTGLRDQLSQYYQGFEHISSVLSQPSGVYRERLWSRLPGDVVYRWRVGDGVVDTTRLADGVQRLMSSPDIDQAANSELAYTAAMVFYLRQYQQRARALLTHLSGGQ